MSEPRYLDGHTPYMGETLAEAARGYHNVPVKPLAQYLEDAANAFAGIECVLGLVAASDIRENYFADDKIHVDACFSPSQRAHLLGLAEVSAKLMRDEASRISEWADDYFHPKKGAKSD